MLFGYVGDCFSRNRVLILSIILMALPTFLLDCLPTDAEIGDWVTVLLVGIRLIQGLSVGGESSGSPPMVATWLVDISGNELAPAWPDDHDRVVRHGALVDTRPKPRGLTLSSCLHDGIGTEPSA